jgi:hypothetical protein
MSIERWTAVEYCMLKRKEILVCAITWENLEGITVNKPGPKG